jgi:hypothetical protein
MGNIKIKWNDKITKFVEKVGGKKYPAEGVGMYSINNVIVFLGSSGEEPWQITKNILRQLAD